MPLQKEQLTTLSIAPLRLHELDALRGLAMVWMTIFHLSFDLNYFGWIRQDFYTDPVWVWQRSCIVSVFLFCVGWSQANVQIFLWKRWLQIAGCALLVTVSSYLMYPQSFIYFGVLHGIAVMLLVLWVIRPLGPWLWGVGVLCLGLFFYPPFVANDTPWNVLGLVSKNPITEDYVPLLPWLALVCFGYAFGQCLIGAKKKGLSHALNPFLKPFATLGRCSLRYYILHQPVLIGTLWLVTLLTRS